MTTVNVTDPDLDLLEGMDRLQSVLPLSEGVIRSDHTLDVRAANHAAAALLGWDTAHDLVQALNQTSWSVMDPAVRRSMQTTLAVRGRWEGQTVLRRRDGGELDATITACTLRGSPGVPSGVIMVIRPVHGVAPPDGPDPRDAYQVSGLPGRFVLYYQPEIDLRTGVVASAESLLRWHHPGLGTVSPGAALADASWAMRLAGLEVWSVFAACRQAATWADQSWPIRVSVNLSHHHLEDPELVDRFRRALTVTGVPRRCLAVEMPFSALSDMPMRARRVAADLDTEGVSVIIDDVNGSATAGTFDGIRTTAIKLDRSLTSGISASPTQQETVRRALLMAASLGATVTAEAIETTADLEVVRALGCHGAFGHVFSPPQTAADLRTLCGFGGNALV
ncbi:MAG: phospholipase [Acidimicrobiales bacterium]|nr:phospholipase [Acidimicrobiales bacterium]